MMLLEEESALLQAVLRVAQQDSASNTNLPTIPLAQCLLLLTALLKTASPTKALFKDRKIKKVQELQKYLEKLVTTKDGFKTHKSCAPPSAPSTSKHELAFLTKPLPHWALQSGEINAIQAQPGAHLSFSRQSLSTDQEL